MPEKWEVEGGLKAKGRLISNRHYEWDKLKSIAFPLKATRQQLD